MIGIYRIYHKDTGKAYIGQSRNIEQRLREHKKGSSKGAIGNALRKYGKAGFVFEVLEVCSENNIHARECHWIAALDCIAPNGYNLTAGGEGGSPSEETRKKISETKKGQTSWNKGRKASAETRKKISDATKGHTRWKGKKHSAESRKKISEALKGNTPWNKGKPRSAETRRKVSEAKKGQTPWMKGRKHSAESRKKMSETKRKRRAERQARKNDRQLEFDF